MIDGLEHSWSCNRIHSELLSRRTSSPVRLRASRLGLQLSAADEDPKPSLSTGSCAATDVANPRPFWTKMEDLVSCDA